MGKIYTITSVVHCKSNSENCIKINPLIFDEVTDKNKLAFYGQRCR